MAERRPAASSGVRRQTTAAPVWHACQHCTATPTFQSTADFVRHLQEKHCTRLDTTPTTTSRPSARYICRFGPGGVCSVATTGADNHNNRRRPPPNSDECGDDDDTASAAAADDDSADDTFEQHALRHHLSPILPNNQAPPPPADGHPSASRKHSTVSQRSVGSVASVAGSVASVVSTLSDWSLHSSAQNLPAVLNDPSRGKQSNLFTKKWGDGFVDKSTIAASPHLPDVTHADLDAYMQRIVKRHRRHERLKAIEAAPPSPPTAPTAADASGDQLTDIPAVFLQPNLRLSDPATFALVFPGLESAPSVRQPPNASAAAAAAVLSASATRLHLQERLTHYLDVVEVHITRKVAAQSGAFFAAMTSQQAIMSEMHAAMLNVRRLRGTLRHVDRTAVTDGLRICAQARRRSNAAAVLAKMRCMREVHKTQPMIQLLLGTADYVAAIDLIASTQALLASELRDVVCVKHLPSQLQEMERLIDKMLRTEFERFATADLNRRRRREEEEEDEGDGIGSVQVEVADEEKLASIVWGLLRQRNFAFIDTYRDEAIVTVRAHIKEMLIEVLASGDADTCLTGAGEESQALSIGEWIELLDRATGRLLRLLRRVRAVIAVMERVAAQSAGEPLDAADIGYYEADAFLTRADKDTVLRKLADVMHEVCQYCHERCATLISAQSLERSVATAGQVERLQRVVGAFCAGCERLTQGGGGDRQTLTTSTACVPLLAALKAQATRFAQRFHADRKAKLALLLDGERWRPMPEVPAALQRLVDAIAAGRWTQPEAQKIVVEPPPPSVIGGDVKAETLSGSVGGAALLVAGEPFVLVGSALILLQIIDEYARCAVQLPICAAQLARHAVDLLRTFNSRCCQLVLGAGALRVAGLKTITSANLALVARALQLVVWLLPHMRRHFQWAGDPERREAVGAAEQPPQPPPPPVVVNGNGVQHHSTGGGGGGGGYDIVERDLLSHIAEIDAMILSIVTQVVTSQMDAWTARPPVPSASFRQISRQFVKLHEAIAPILPAAQVARLYGAVHRTFKDKLRDGLRRCGVRNNGGPAHGVVTAELTFYAETVRQLGVLAAAAGDGGVDELSDEAMADVWTEQRRK